jgi:hypothetical protein
MISNISSIPAGATAPAFSTVHTVPSPSKGTTSNEDTVQLSPETQQHLANTRSSSPPASLDQIIKEAAGGDITALAKLALVG